jgi:hypothetical protein
VVDWICPKICSLLPTQPLRVDEVLLALKEINAKDNSIRSLREECETELVIPMEQALQTSGRLEGTRVPSVLECVEMQLALAKYYAVPGPRGISSRLQSWEQNGELMKLTFTSEAGLVSEDFSASQIINGEVIPISFDEEGEYEKWIEGSKVSVSGAALKRQEGEVTKYSYRHRQTKAETPD